MKLTPYWWENAPLYQQLDKELDDNLLPSHCEVLIIGSGYTGLQAALQTARSGLDTVVVDAKDLGIGCSTRNGGQVSNSIKPDFDYLAKKHGEQKAYDLIQEGFRSQQYLNDFITSEQLDCDWYKSGRYIGAHNPAAYRAMEHEAAKPIDRRKAYPIELVTQAEQGQHIQTDFYHGGLFYPHVYSVNPAKYHSGLLQKVQLAGARLIAHCRVNQIGRTGVAGDLSSQKRFRVQTALGEITANKVIIATNGYTEGLSSWHQRRVISIGSYIIATEPMAAERLAELLPTQEMICDSRKLIFYYRKCPEGKRIIFGGRVSLTETDPEKCTPLLQKELGKIFPSMMTHPVTHSWEGFIAYSFDHMPHIGEDNGLHYAMGYCGSGVGLSSYFGMRVGQQAAGLAEGATALDNLAFPTRPLYYGNPWFLAPSLRFYQWRDRLPIA